MDVELRRELGGWFWCVLLALLLLGLVRKLPTDEQIANPEYRDYPVEYGRANDCPSGWRLQEGPVEGDVYRCWKVQQ